MKKKLDKYSLEELIELQTQIQNDPKNQNSGTSINKYTPEARKKLEQISFEITHRIKKV